MVMQFFTGQISSQMPQPEQASRLGSYVPAAVISNAASGQFSQHSVHLVQVEKFTTGRCVRVEYFLNSSLGPGRKPPTSVFGCASVASGFHVPAFAGAAGFTPKSHT